MYSIFLTNYHAIHYCLEIKKKKPATLLHTHTHTLFNVCCDKLTIKGHSYGCNVCHLADCACARVLQIFMITGFFKSLVFVRCNMSSPSIINVVASKGRTWSVYFIKVRTMPFTVDKLLANEDYQEMEADWVIRRYVKFIFKLYRRTCYWGHWFNI